MPSYDSHLQRTLRAQGVKNDAALTIAQELYSLATRTPSQGMVEDPADPGTYIVKES